MKRKLDFDTALDAYTLPSADAVALAEPWAAAFGADGTQAVSAGIVAMPYFMPDSEGNLSTLGAPTLALPAHAPVIPTDGSGWAYGTLCLGWQWLWVGRKPLTVSGSSAVSFGLDDAAAVEPLGATAIMVEGPKDFVAVCAALATLRVQGVMPDNVFALGVTGANTAPRVLRECQDVFLRIHGMRLPRLVVAFDGDKAGTMAACRTADMAASLNTDCRILAMPYGDGFDCADAFGADADYFANRLLAAVTAEVSGSRTALVAAFDRSADPKSRERMLSALGTDLQPSAASEAAKAHKAHKPHKQHNRRKRHKPARRDFNDDPLTKDELIEGVVSLGAVKNAMKSTTNEWRGSCPICGGRKRLAIFGSSSGGLICYHCPDGGKAVRRDVAREISRRETD